MNTPSLSILFESEITGPASMKYYFSWKSKLIKYLLWLQTLSTLTQKSKKSKLLNKYQIWWEFLKIGCKYQTAEGLVVWKHLPAAIRYQDTLLISPLIFRSASILCRSLHLSYVLISPGSISQLEPPIKNIKRAGRTDCKLFVFIQHSCRNGPCLSESQQGSCFSDIICAQHF